MDDRHDEHRSKARSKEVRHSKERKSRSRVRLRENAEEEKHLAGLVGGLYEGLIIRRVLFTPWCRRKTSYANDRRKR